MAAADEGMRAAAEFARFSAQLDDTFKVVSKPKEWQPSDQTAAHYPRWAFLMRAYFSLIHPSMPEWLRVVEGTLNEDEVDIKRMSPTEKLYSRVVYNILVQVLSRGHCSIMVLQRAKDMNGFRLWRRLKEEFEPISESRFYNMLTTLLDFHFSTDMSQIKQAIVKYELAVDRYEEASREEFPDRFKKATLVRAMPKEIKTHIHLSMTDKDTYASIKELIIEFVNVSRDFSQTGVADI